MTVGLVLGLLLTPAWATTPEPPATEVSQPERPPSGDIEAMRREMEAMQRELAVLRARQEAPSVTPSDQPERVGFGIPVQVPEGQEVDEVVSFGDDVHVAGHVLGDAISFGGDVRIAQTGQVDGDAVSFGGVVDVDDGGQVAGNRVAMEMPLQLPAVATSPEGDVNASGHLVLASDASDFLRSLYRRAVWMLSVAGAGVLVVGLFPGRVTRVAQDLESRPVRAAVVGTLATGFLALFSVLFAVVTLGLGFPISVLLMGVLSVAWLLGFVGLCQAVGDRLPVQDRHGFAGIARGRWIAFLVGVVLLTFLGSLPWVGWFVVGGASVLGIGAALSTRFGAV